MSVGVPDQILVQTADQTVLGGIVEGLLIGAGAGVVSAIRQSTDGRPSSQLQGRLATCPTAGKTPAKRRGMRSRMRRKSRAISMGRCSQAMQLFGR